MGTKDQRDTHLDHRNKPLTLRFSGSTVFKPIKKQGRGQQGTVSNIQEIKKQNVISYSKSKMYTLKQSQKGNTFKRRAELEARSVPSPELAQSAVTQSAFGEQTEQWPRAVSQSTGVTQGLRFVNCAILGSSHSLRVLAEGRRVATS